MLPRTDWLVGAGSTGRSCLPARILQESFARPSHASDGRDRNGRRSGDTSARFRNNAARNQIRRMNLFHLQNSPGAVPRNSAGGSRGPHSDSAGKSSSCFTRIHSESVARRSPAVDELD